MKPSSALRKATKKEVDNAIRTLCVYENGMHSIYLDEISPLIVSVSVDDSPGWVFDCLNKANEYINTIMKRHTTMRNMSKTITGITG